MPQLCLCSILPKSYLLPVVIGYKQTHPMYGHKLINSQSYIVLQKQQYNYKRRFDWSAYFYYFELKLDYLVCNYVNHRNFHAEIHLPQNQQLGFHLPTPNLKPLNNNDSWIPPPLFTLVSKSIWPLWVLLLAYPPTACQKHYNNKTKIKLAKTHSAGLVFDCTDHSQLESDGIVWRRMDYFSHSKLNAQREDLIIIAIGWRITDTLTGFQSANFLSSSITPLPLFPPFPSPLPSSPLPLPPSLPYHHTYMPA